MAIRKSFLFVRYFNMTIAASGTLETGAKVQNLCMLFRGEALRHFYLLSSEVEIIEPLTMEYTIKR